MSILKPTERALLDEPSVNQLLSGHPALKPHAANASLHQGQAGVVPNTHRGSGTEFDDLRPFQPGDDPKQIDWRATARSQQTLVRSYLSEFQQPLYLVIDRSASMRFGSQIQLKVTLAARLALTLAGIFHQAGREVGGLLLSPKPEWYPASTSLNNLRQFSAATVTACPPTREDNLEWHRIFALLREQIPRGAKLVLISDFLTLDERAALILGDLAQQTDLSAVLVSDPLEHQLPAESGMRLIWGAKSVELQNQAAVAQLQATLEEQRDKLRSHFDRTGIELLKICTSSESLDDAWLGRLM